MGNGAVDLAAGMSAVWAGNAWRACWQGGLFLLVVWLACRLLPRLPAAGRVWLWWLACLKLLVGLFCLSSVPLPVLPASRPAPVAPRDAKPAAALRPPTRILPAGPAPDTGSAGQAPGQENTESPRAAPAPPPHGTSRPLPAPAVLFGVVWLAGCAGFLVLGFRHALALRRLLKGGGVRPGAAPVQAEADRLARHMGLRRAVPVIEAPGASVPFVLGLLRPRIVVPEGFADTLSDEQMRMVLAHELAHVRRGDLWLGFVPACAQTLFFFFPPVWLACREYAAAREEACDVLALRATGGSAAGYGRLLLLMVAGDLQGRHRAALGLTSGFAALRQRLSALKHAPDALSQRSAARVLAVPVALGLLFVVPWRLTTAAPARNASGTSAGARSENGLQPRYALTELGTLGGNYSHAYAINESGQVVGAASLDDRAGRGRAFLWDPWREEKVMRDLGALAGTRRSLASGINNRGQIIAASYNSTRYPHSFLWKERRRYLETPPGFRFSRAVGINDGGQIVGVAQTGGYDRGALEARAVLWTAAGKTRDLGTLGGRYSHAYAVNDRGQVVGKADVSADEAPRTHAFLWEQGAMRDLGVLPGGRNSLAHAVNDRGQVVGVSDSADAPRAFVWEAGVMRDLGALPGGAASQAYAINNAGQIVGSAEADAVSGSTRAVLWADGTVLDLNTCLPPDSGWVLTEARGINDRGQIVGQGIKDGRQRAFLLTPTPLVTQR